ncbi:MAG: ATP synthase F0 subunit B [Myxococcales bacterium]|jgi:F-type H+-transporting ATPase subunit b
MRWAGILLVALCAWAPFAVSAETAVDTSLAHEIAEEESGQDTHAAAQGHELSFSNLLESREFRGTVFNFVVLVGLFVWVVRSKINPALAARRADVEQELAEAQRLRAEAEQRHRETASRLERLDQEMVQIRAEMVKAGEAERDRIVSQAEEKAARIRKDTHFFIEQQVKQLRKDLTQEAANAAVEAAQELLAKTTTQADQDRVAEAYLSRLDDLIEEKRSS